MLMSNSMCSFFHCMCEKIQANVPEGYFSTESLAMPAPSPIAVNSQLHEPPSELQCLENF